jgi:fucose permease
VRRLAHPTDPEPATAALAGVAAVVAAGWWLARNASAVRAAERTEPPTATPHADALGVRTLLATYGVLIFLYVGTETAVSGWVAEFARRMRGGAGSWAMAPTAFWSAQTGGRLLVPLLLRRVRPLTLIRLGTIVGGLAVGWLATQAESANAVIGCAALAGLGLAPIFPLLWAGVVRDVAPRLTSSLGPLFAAGGLGGAVLPWGVGLISSDARGLSAGLLVPFVALAAMLALMPLASRAERR